MRKEPVNWSGLLRYAMPMKSFWDTDIISGTSINYLPTPHIGPISLNIICYIVVLVVAGGLFLFLRGRRHFRDALVVSILAGFAAATIAFSLRMDLNWVVLADKDARNLYGKALPEMFAYLDGNDFFEFIEFVRSSIPPGEEARVETDFEGEAEEQVYEMGRYYLLPTLTTGRGRYIWVYHRRGVSFDPNSGVLRLNGRKAYLVRLHTLYRPGAGVFRIEGEL